MIETYTMNHVVSLKELEQLSIDRTFFEHNLYRNLFMDILMNMRERGDDPTTYVFKLDQYLNEHNEVSPLITYSVKAVPIKEGW